MNKPDVAYVELTFPQSVKDYLTQVTQEIVSSSDYYSSPVVPHINGSVTDKAHLTFFYGLDPNAKEDEKLNELISNADVKTLKLGGFMLMNGYQDLYKILTIKVIDEDRTLTGFTNKIRKFSDRPNSYEFKPHITLAYVNFDYELPENLPELKESIEGDKLQVTVS